MSKQSIAIKGAKQAVHGFPLGFDGRASALPVVLSIGTLRLCVKQ